MNDGVDADTDGLMGDVGDGAEIVLGVLAGYGVQIDQPGGGVKAGAGFVEAYMAVAANAQQLQVDTAKAGYFVFVGSAVLGDAVGRTVGVWDVYIIGLYIYMLKQILLHKVGVAVLVLGDNWVVLIEVKTDDIGEAQAFVLVHSHQFLIDQLRGIAGGQAQNRRLALVLPLAYKRGDLLGHI